MNPHAGLVGATRKLVRKFGYDVVHHLDFGNLLHHLGVDLLIDVGANIGQTYDKFRLAGYAGQIASFEPHPDCFKQLQQRADPSGNWSRHNTALGPEDADQKLFFGPTSDQTSLLTGAGGDGSISVRVRSLDSLWSELKFDRCANVFLKTDAEGFDFQVLRGAQKHFPQIVGGVMELRPVPAYDSESPMNEVLNYLAGHGFVVCRMDSDSLQPATGICTGFNVTFCRRNFLTHLK